MYAMCAQEKLEIVIDKLTVTQTICVIIQMSNPVV